MRKIPCQNEPRNIRTAHNKPNVFCDIIMHLMAFGTKTKKKAYLWIISALQAFSSFEYLFFVFMDITFLYYISEGRDDVISGSTKTVQHSVTSLTNISRNITLVLFKLGTRTVTHKK